MDAEGSRKPRIKRGFIGSSKESLEIARAVQEQLQFDAETTVWTDDIFSLSRIALDDLTTGLASYDFCIFVADGNDLTVSRQQANAAPRDNVVFEVGLAMGCVGVDRTFILQKGGANLKMPTDLLGLTVAHFTERSDGNVLAAVGPACNQIRRALGKLTDKRKFEDWPTFLGHVRELANRLRASPNRGGFSFDVLIGISRGGIVVADLLARLFGGNVPVTCLWADRHTSYPNVKFDGNFCELNGATLQGLSAGRFKNLLIVDDATRTGTTIRAAKEYVATVGQANIRTCAIYASQKSVGVDYYVAELGPVDRETPFSAIEKI